MSNPANALIRSRFGPSFVVAPALAVVAALGFGVLGGVVAALAAAVVGLGWSLLLGFIATRLSRRESWRPTVANTSLFLAVLGSGMLAGGALLEEMLMNAGLSTPSTTFTMIHPPFGGAFNLFIITLNTLMEWLLIPAALFLNWRIPKRRTFIVIAAVIYYLMRAWSYIYFIPNIFEFGAIPMGGPFPAELVERFRLWVGLSWFRGLVDILTNVLFILAAFVPASLDGNSRQPAGREAGIKEGQPDAVAI